MPEKSQKRHQLQQKRFVLTNNGPTVAVQTLLGTPDRGDEGGSQQSGKQLLQTSGKSAKSQDKRIQSEAIKTMPLKFVDTKFCGVCRGLKFRVGTKSMWGALRAPKWPRTRTGAYADPHGNGKLYWPESDDQVGQDWPVASQKYKKYTKSTPFYPNPKYSKIYVKSTS